MLKEIMKNNMYYLQLLIFIVSISSNAAPSTPIDNEDQYRHPKKLHYSREAARQSSKEFPCEEPQSRAYILPDLMQRVNPNPQESVNLPFYIILKRCDVHSGCCKTNLSCTPTISKIYFEDIEIEIHNIQTSNTRREWIQVEQHGKCNCEVTTPKERYESETKNPSIKILRPREATLNS